MKTFYPKRPARPFAAFGHGMQGGFIYAIDLCNAMNTMSITNDAEAVVQYLLAHYGNHRIIYKDTDDRWDELAHDGKQFTGFKPMPTCFSLKEEA